MKTSMLLLVLGLATPLAGFSQTHWQQTSGNVTFTIKNMGSNVEGHFGAPNTTLIFSPDKLGTSSLKGNVAVSGINTGIKKRDKDLQGDKYFDAGKYKLIEVASTKITGSGNKFNGTFNVTIKGVTKQVEMPF